jgi:chromosome segregation ATPase
MALLGVAMAMTGCAHSAFERQVRAGSANDILYAFAADSSLQRDAQALRTVARVHLDPDGRAWDPARALQLLEQARSYDRRRTAQGDDLVLESLLRVHLEQLATAGSREQRLSDSVAQLVAEVRRAQDLLTERTTELSAQREERDLLQRLVARLEADLRARELQLVELRLELDRLKAIDLSPSRPSRPSPPE